MSKILCLDMDAYFASVEIASNPKLKNKPIGIVGSADRTVVTTASYEARKYGVKTGMPKFMAQKLCPHIKFIVGNFKKYLYISTQIHEFLKTITYKVEMYSIDEAFIDISDVAVTPKDLGYLIKSHIKNNFGITCTVGVGKSKLVAKMATEINKPDGLNIINDEDVYAFLDTFSLNDIWGIGKKLTKKLNSLGIYSTKDIRKLNKDFFIKTFGKNGEKIYGMAFGEYPEGVKYEDEPIKSIGHSITLPKDTFDRKLLDSYILQLSDMVSFRARKAHIAGKTITFHLRYSDMTKFSKMHTIGYPTSATHQIYEIAKHISKDIDMTKGVRHVGVSLGNLIYSCGSINDIFSKKWENVYSAIDSINHKYGNLTITFANVLNCQRLSSNTLHPWQKL
ncbi:MAG: polymerase [Deferribacteraceae bacterium]|nr:polymerase [Deferribacteraceae bacterium]